MVVCSQNGRFKAKDTALGIKNTETIECRQPLKSGNFLLVLFGVLLDEGDELVDIALNEAAR